MSIASADVQEMLDEYALRKLVHGYSRAVDRGDLDTLRSLYHPDAQDSHGSFSSGSVDTFLRTLAETRPYIRSMQHHITRDTPKGRPGSDDPSHEFFSLLRPSGQS
jgi:hypothetical protein